MNMFMVKNKEELQVDLSKVKELRVMGDGFLLIQGRNSHLKFGFYHVEFRSIYFGILNPSASSFVESVTDDMISIKIRNLGNGGGERREREDVHEDKEIIPTWLQSQTINLHEVSELHFTNSGTVLIPGDNSLLSLEFHDGDFTFINFTIEDTDLNKMRVSDVVDGRISIKVLPPDEW